jgi:hypothetical protein
LALHSRLIISRVIDGRIQMESILGADLGHGVFNVANLSSGIFLKELVGKQDCNISRLFLTVFDTKEKVKYEYIKCGPEIIPAKIQRPFTSQPRPNLQLLWECP